jgi:hypothetical protein
MGALSRDDASVLRDFSDAQWAEFLAECDLHWTSPLAYRVLAAHRDRVAAPGAVWRGLKRSYLLSRSRTRRADALLIPVLAALEAAGLPVIVLKGLHLSTQVYADPAMRPMIDADLLLRRSDLPAAARIVESFGFRQRDADRGAPSDPALPRDDHHHLDTFYYPKGPPIELHHDLWVPGARLRVDMDGVWSRARPSRIGGAGVWVLAPEDALLHLCLHAGVGHGFEVKLLSLCDLPVALRRWQEEIDWEAFWSRAHRWRAERSAVLTLAFVCRRLGYPLPDAAWRPLLAWRSEIDGLMKVAERRMRRKAAALAWRAKSGSSVVVGGQSTVALRAAMGRLPAFRDRTRFLAARVFVRKGELAAWFGMETAPFWVPVLHPVRILLVSARQAYGLARLAVWRTSGRGLEAEARMLDWLGGG